MDKVIFFGKHSFLLLYGLFIRGKRNRPADENIVQSVSTVIVGEDGRRNDVQTSG